MAKKESKWIFNNSICRNNDIAVDLKLTRLKNPKNFREQLRIEIKQNKADSGTFICGLAEIENDLQMLREFGVMVQRVDKMDIRRLIDENYNEINILKLDSQASAEAEVTEVYEYICRYIKEELNNNSEKTAVFEKLDAYNISVVVFNSLMVGNTYSFSNDYFRERFEQLGLTICDKGRTARTIRIEEKDGKSGQMKCLSFKKAEADAKIIALESLPVTDVTE